MKEPYVLVGMRIVRGKTTRVFQCRSRRYWKFNWRDAAGALMDAADDDIPPVLKIAPGLNVDDEVRWWNGQPRLYGVH